MEVTCSFREIKFNIKERLNELNKLKEQEEKIIKKKDEQNFEKLFSKKIDSRLIDPSINYSKEENPENNRGNIFLEKYSAEINIKEFETRAEKSSTTS